jgi:hypothetical protein
MQILSHRNTPPSLRWDIPFYVDGSASHRRVVSSMRGGPDDIDIDYNQYKAGLAHSNAFAYPFDEIGYITSGEVMLVSDGEKRAVAPGSFMWRPAQAATQQIRFLTNCISICAFAPARHDDWEYQLPSEDVGKWDSADGEKPRVQFFHYSQIEPVDHAGAPDNNGVIHRPVISLAGNGSRRMSVSHTTLRQGTVLPIGPVLGTVIHWLESGRIQVLATEEARELSPTNFLYYQPDDAPQYLIALEDSVYITWAAANRLDV